MSVSAYTSTSSQPTMTLWKRKVLFAVSFFLIVFLFKLLFRGYESLLNPALGLMVVGAVLGMGIRYLDMIVYAYVTAPEEDFSMHLKSLIRHKKIIDAIKSIDLDHSDARKLSTNNVLFLVVWVVLAVVLLSSSLNYFARGFILGIGLQLSLDLIQDLEKPAYLNKRLFWPIARKVSNQEMKITVYVFLGSFLFLSLFAI